LAEYKNRGILIQVDGMGSVSEVEEKINSALRN
jgi:adenylate kinase family enzyme